MKILNRNELNTIKKILVIQLGPIGDALLTTSYFAALKKNIPGVEIHYLIKQQYSKAIFNHPYIDKVIKIEKQSGIKYFMERLSKIKKMRAEKYQLVIDQQNMPSTQQIAFLSGARYRLGYADGRMSCLYNLKAPRQGRRYSALKKFDMLIPLGINEQSIELFFYISGESKKYIIEWLNKNKLETGGFICVSPGSPIKRKKWKLDNYIKLIDVIAEEIKIPVVMLWAPTEKIDAQYMADKTEYKPLIAPPTDLQQAAYLIKQARLLICNDGGLNHLAAAIGAKSLAIFGTTDPLDWSPAPVFNTHHHVYNPDADSFKDDSFGISVDDVMRKITEIIGTN